MTSNAGFHQDSVGFLEEISKNDSKLKEILSIELLNRIQKVIYFKPLDKKDITAIIKNKLVLVKKRFQDRNIKVSISETFIQQMVLLSRYQEFGARKIDQVIEDKIDDYVIDNILDGKTEIYVNSN